MKKLSVIAATLSIIIGLVAVYLWLVPLAPKTAPDISLNVIDGRKIDLKSLQGKPLLVTFWATSCATCLQEMPHLVALYDELNKDGFEIVGIAMPYDPPNRVVALANQKNIPYPIVLDIDGSAVRAFGDVDLTPSSFLINPDGKIIEQQTGTMDMKTLRLKVKSFLTTDNASLS